jgi:anaerobic magnesium-protoporphyrin IX monomethyl ester cyclase
MHVAFVSPFDWPILSYGLTSVMTAVKQAGHQVSLVDTALLEGRVSELTARRLGELRPHVVGFPAMTTNLERQLQIARLVRQELPDAHLLWGGTHALLLPEDLIARPEVDAVCVTEGEHAVPEHLAALDEPRAVPGIWRQVSGRVLRGADRRLPDDLDALAWPDWGLWNLEEHLRRHLWVQGALPVATSRGCPLSCAFCSNATLRRRLVGRYCRHRSAASVIAEVQHNLQRWPDFRFLHINDDSFGIDRRRLREFCATYREAGLHRILPWGCQTPVSAIDDEWARLAAEAGCVLINPGLESGVEEHRLQVLNKPIRDADYRRAAAALARHGIICAYNMIIGTPAESLGSLARSLAFAYSLRPLWVHPTLLITLPETPLRALLEREELLDPRRRHADLPRARTRHLGLRPLDAVMALLRLERAARILAVGLRTFGPAFLGKAWRRARGVDGDGPGYLRSFFLLHLERMITQQMIGAVSRRRGWAWRY